MSVGRWLADNAIPWGLAGVAFAGSYSHLVTLGQTHGVHGALAYTTAGCVDAIVAMAARERQRDKRTGRAHWGWTSWPVVVLCTGVLLTLAGNLATAQHSAWGWIMAGVPPTALLFAISMLERRAGRRPATSEVVAAVAQPVRATCDAVAPATIVALPAVPTTNGRGATQAVMREHWEAEVAAGRLPTGADLNRAAGKDAGYSLGKRYAQQWRHELHG